MSIRKLVVANGICYVEIPAAGIYLLCGAPADSVKHLLRRGIIQTTEVNGVSLRERAERDPAVGLDDPERAPVQPGRVPHPADALPPGHADSEPSRTTPGSNPS
jgi:hypothetical protein